MKDPSLSTLTPEQWRLLSPYLDQALTLPEGQRARWLESLRAENGALADQVQALLKEQLEAEKEGFLQKGVLLPLAGPGLAGQIVGAYRLLSPIGQGGMGTVWLAERSDGRFERKAAVKFLSVALVGHGGEGRFKREGAILGRLSHPNIAELLDAGVSTSGQPYLVIEYVEGQPIDRYCDQRKLDLRCRIRLFLDVLAAVAHAHTNLIVHRDIKPSNVMVSTDGKVKLLDFGIAKLLEAEGQEGTATVLTREAGSPLTPEYAAPEQLTGGVVTTETDVYTLGVLLYVLLTGQHPAGAGPLTPAELLRAITETEPRRPSEVVMSSTSVSQTGAANRGTFADKLRRQLRGDLDTIVAKTLKKNPRERYASVPGLAEDLEHYLANEPISARPDSMAYVAAKFVRRNRMAVALATLAVVATVAGLVGTLLQARTARMQRDFALRQVGRSEALNEFHQFLLSDAAPSGKPFTTNDLLKRAEEIIAKQHAPNDPDRVLLMISIGRQYLEQDEQAGAHRVLEEAYKLSREMSDKAVRAEASCDFAAALVRDMELERAESLYQEGLRELPTDPQFALERVDCLQSGLEIAQENGNIQEGISRAEMAQRVLRSSPFDSDALELHRWTDLGKVYGSASRDGKAIMAHEQAAALVAKLGRDDTRTAATLYNNWALELVQVGRPLEAERLYRRAIDITKVSESENDVSPIVLHNYAISLRELGRIQEAADNEDLSYRIAQKVGGQGMEGRIMLERARIYTAQHNPAQASVLLAKVEDKFHKDLPAGHFAFAVLAGAQALNELESGDIATATKHADQAVSIDEAAVKSGGEGSYYLPTLLTIRATVELASHHLDTSAADATRAVSLLQAGMEPGTFSNKLGRAYLILGHALTEQGKSDEAHAAFRSAADNLQTTVGTDHPEYREARQLAGQELARE